MTLSPGSTLGRYQILEQLGEGGMSTVYKAYQPALERTVALKVIRRGFAEDREFRERFGREAKAIARLTHPHIVQVFDYDEAAGELFLAMQYLRGGTLKAHLAALAERGQVLGADETVRILRQVAAALDHAHREGVIHRDVKPANVMLDADGNAIVTDFGIAKIVGGTAHTQTGVGTGTPEYMSPEQGQGMALDGRADLYSLGVMAFEMLTGRLPYTADTPVAIVLKHLSDPLPLPSSVRPDLGAEIDRVLMRALAKDPADRHATAIALVDALAAALDARPGRTLPTIVVPLGPRVGRLTRPLVAAAAIGALLIGGGGTLVLGTFGTTLRVNAEDPVATTAPPTATRVTSTPPIPTTPAPATTPPPPPTTPPPTPGPPVRITIEPANALVLEGSTVQLTAAVVDANGTRVSTAVSWTMVQSERDCFPCGSVDQRGLFTAKYAPPSDGQARVRATAGSLSGDVVVSTRTFSNIFIEPVGSLVQDTSGAYLMEPGKQVQFKATVIDAKGAAIQELGVSWKISPKSGWCGHPDEFTACATVSGSGLVTAVGKGSPDKYFVNDKTQVCATTSNPRGYSAVYSTERCAPIRIT